MITFSANLWLLWGKTDRDKLRDCKCKVKSLSRVQLFATLCTVTQQGPLSMGFPRQEYWSRLHFILQGIFQTLGSNPGLPHWRKILYHLSHQGIPTERLELTYTHYCIQNRSLIWTYCTEQGIQQSIMTYMGKNNLKKSGYMYNRYSLLYTWN